MISISGTERKAYIPMHACMEYGIRSSTYPDPCHRGRVQGNRRTQGTGSELEGVCSPSIARKRREEKEVTKNCLPRADTPDRQRCDAI